MDLREQLSKFIKGWRQATKEQFREHPIANLFRVDLKDEIESIVKMCEPLFDVKASVGAGNWANVPWLSILNPEITSTTQDGIYPVYLFRADGSGFYLSLNQGTTTPTKNLGKKRAEERADKIKKIIQTKLPKLSNWGVPDIDLRAETTLGKSYENPNIAAKYYDANDIPSSDELIDDLKTILDFYKEIKAFNIDSLLNNAMNIQPEERAGLSNVAPLSKPFLLLAGISGTGKTRFVREQAKAMGAFNKAYCLTSVRPDWHEPSDLLGYISRLNSQAEYITTDVLQFIAKAWRAILDAGLTIEAIDIDGQGKCLAVTGNRDALNGVLPCWLCLDEMNLAPVEQYFADYLSILETREWHWDNDTFRYLCDPLLKPATIEQLADDSQLKLKHSLGFADAKYDNAWGLFCRYGLAIPLNLIVAGTVNMDETTHGFSRKVIDRALSFDFGEFFPNDFEQYFESKVENKLLSYPIWSKAALTDLAATFDSEGKQSIAFLNAVNELLANTPFKLAYRALNELLLAVISQNPQDELTLKAIWDDFLMCKVLPRIEGDYDKLGNDQSLLEKLSILLQSQFAEFWDKENNDLGARPDLFRKKKEGDDRVIRITCRSKEKLAWMQARLSAAGFTSFWP